MGHIRVKKLSGREGIPTHQQINDLEDRIVEITATEQKIEKRMKRNEDSVRDPWDNTKCMKNHIPRRKLERERT